LIFPTIAAPEFAAPAAFGWLKAGYLAAKPRATT